MLCEELLNGTTLVESEKKSFEMKISMLEIYNEKIQDLLAPFDQRRKEGLKIRENPQTGVFVDRLTKSPVKSYADIEKWIEFGNKHKTIAATLMNATSSRAHTVISIELLQKEVMEFKTIQKTSQINLVDLAGSEKVMKTGAEGDRLKEACSINTSLTQLGIVITQLCEASEGKNVLISYRDSILTRLLSNALGGNSRTTMICAVSPDRNNIDETISTLRYANNAKNIKQKAKINESEIDKKIRELVEENEKLKMMLSNLEKGTSNVLQSEDLQSQIKQVELSITNQNQILKKSVSMQPEKVAQVVPEITIENIKVSHMYNLNEDPYLTGRIIYNLEETPFIAIGRENSSDSQNQNPKERKITLNSVGILEEHAKIVYFEKRLSLVIDELQAAEATFVNGESIENFIDEDAGYIRELQDWDRIIFGTSSTFLVRLVNESGAIVLNNPDGHRIDWEFCQKEKFNTQEKYMIQIQKQKDEENERRFREQEDKLREEMMSTKNNYEKQLQAQQAEYKRIYEELQVTKKDDEKTMQEDQENLLEVENQQKLFQIQEIYKNKELEFQAFLNVLQKEKETFEKNRLLSNKIENYLFNYYAKVREANLIAKELNRNIEFSPFVKSLNLLNTLNRKDMSIEHFVNVKVTNKEDGWINYWSLEQFDNRLVLIKDAIDYFFSRNQIKYTQENDPFWDPEEFFLNAQCFLMGKSIPYRFEIAHKVGLVGYDGDIGHFDILLTPLDDDFKPINEEEFEEEIEDPEDLMKNEMSCHYRISIDKITFYDIEKLQNKSAYMQYEIMESQGIKEYRTPEFKLVDNQIELNYRQTVRIPEVNNDVIYFYMNENIIFRLYVRGIEKVETLGKKPLPVIQSSRKQSARDPSKTILQTQSFIDKQRKGSIKPKPKGPAKDEPKRSGCHLF